MTAEGELTRTDSRIRHDLLADTSHLCDVFTRVRVRPNRSGLPSTVGCARARRKRDFRRTRGVRISVFLYVSPSFSRSPLMYRTRDFFPSRKKRPLVYLKRRDFIAHSRGNDILSSNHPARIPALESRHRFYEHRGAFGESPEARERCRR